MGYAVTSESIARCGKRLDVYERAVREVLASYADNTGKAWPSILTIVQDSGVSRGKVLACLGTLETKGAIRASRVQGRQTVYHLTELPPVHGTDPSTACTSPQRVLVHTVDLTRPHGVPDPSTLCTGPVHAVDPKDPKKDPKKDPNEGSQDAAAPLALVVGAREGYRTIIDLWSECCPTLPQPRKHDAGSKLGRTLRKCWTAEPSPALWRERFERLAANPWAIATWQPDLGAVLTKLEPLDNGRYDRRAEQTARAFRTPKGAAPTYADPTPDPMTAEEIAEFDRYMLQGVR